MSAFDLDYIPYTSLDNLLREYFVDVLSSFVTGAKFTRHELQEYVEPVCQAESQIGRAHV